MSARVYMRPVRTPKDGKHATRAQLARFAAKLDNLKRKHRLTDQDIRERGGPPQQTRNKWKHGSVPKIETLAMAAEAVGGVFILDVQEKGAAREIPGPSAESVEIVSVVDTKPPAVRERIRDAVYRLADALAPPTPPSPTAGTERPQGPTGQKPGR